jgi:orotate phosphoribosyltransferase
VSAWDDLRERLATDGILRASRDQPIRHLSGVPAPWAFYSWGVTLTGLGLRLAARALLERLESFQSTQLAAYGHTAQPLLGACVLLGGDRYTGLSIRKEPKKGVTGRQIDGPLDRARPVVVLDDSLVSGQSLLAAIRALEADGFEVEGALTLVEFPHRGGTEWAWSNGYRVESLFDIWTDLGMADQPFRPPVGFPAGVPRRGRVPDGLSPAEVARWVARSYLRTGRPPVAPGELDAAYEAPGGAFVSFRRRADDHRLARDGFWRWEPALTEVGEDVVFATVQTLRQARGAITQAILEDCKIGVTLFGPLLASRPAELDFSRYGIVVRDSVSGHKLGGALPNTQVFTSEAGQYWQARTRNARLARTEAHELFRHDLTKIVEPGETWPSYGVPDGPDLAWQHDPKLFDRLTAVASQTSVATLEGHAYRLSTSTRFRGVVGGHGVSAVGVTLYAGGYVGSGLAELDDPRAGSGKNLEALVAEAATRAISGRSAATRSRLLAAARDDSLAVVVTLLHDRERHGTDASLAAFKVRPGLDAITVRSSGGSQTLLPAAGPYNGWGKDELVRRLRSTAAGSAADASWSTSRAASWIRRGDGGQAAVARLEFGYTTKACAPLRDDEIGPMVELMAEHVMRRIGQSPLPSYDLDAITGRSAGVGTTPRLVHAVASLADAGRLLGRADMRAAGRAGLTHCLDRVGTGGVSGELSLRPHTHGHLADCVLLAAALDDPDLVDHPAVDAIGRRLLSLLSPDGRVARRPVRLGDGQDHEYLPSAVLMALAPWHAARGLQAPFDGFAHQLTWQRAQFRAMRTWGMAGWHPQGWAAVHALSGSPDVADHVFEVADWAIDRQLLKDGAFLEDLSEKEPSFNTGFVAEGIAAAWSVALRAGDSERAAAYEASWRRAGGFVRSLMVTPADTFPSRAPAAVVGGVRLTPSSPRLRIDATSHCLHALLAGRHLLEAQPRVQKRTLRDGAAAG